MDSTDGDAADAGRLDARHGGEIRVDASQAAIGPTIYTRGLYSAVGRVRSERALLSPSESRLSEPARAGGGARAHQVPVMTGGGAAPAHKSNFAHSHATLAPPPPYSIFGAGHIFIIITPHIHKVHVKYKS